MFELSNDEFAKYAHESLKIYTKNLDKPLWYSDSLVYETIKDYVPPYSDNFDYPAYVERCKEQKLRFKAFYEERLTHLITIDDKGVDLEAYNALKKLIQQGVHPEDAKYTVSLYKQQQQIIKNLKDDENAFIQSLEREQKILAEEKEANKYLYYVVTGTEIGWINVDKLYELPNAREIEFSVTVNTPVDVNFLNVSMVFSERNTFISGHKNENGNYEFTYDQNVTKTKLPVGEKVTIVAISYLAGQPLLGIKKTTLEDEKTITISASIRNEAKFKSLLNSLGKGESSSPDF